MLPISQINTNLILNHSAQAAVMFSIQMDFQPSGMCLGFSRSKRFR
jgi:hypothetical protein